jgi:hypothetical protein
MMKKTFQWITVMLFYGLLYSGANQLWPLASQFRHPDHQVGPGISTLVRGFALSFAVGVLISMAMKREFTRLVWPLAIAPFFLLLATGYLEDSFYPPYSSDLLALCAAGALQAIGACGAWLVVRRLNKGMGSRLPGEPAHT